jgi:ArsR family metal-binding transcriptional regulator
MRGELIQALKNMFEMAEKLAKTEGASPKEIQHWIRVSGYIGQVINSLTKSFDEAKALESLENLERMIREAKGDSEKSQKP